MLKKFLRNLLIAPLVLIIIILGWFGLSSFIEFIFTSTLPLWIFQLGFFIIFSITIALNLTFSTRGRQLFSEDKSKSYE